MSIIVAAPRAAVWDALVDPKIIERYMPVADFSAEWSEGGTMTWRFEWLGRPALVRGAVLRLDPPRALKYRYSRPIFRAGAAAEPSKRQRVVTIELSDEGTGTRIAVREDNNVTDREVAHAEGGWRLALNNLKALLERTPYAVGDREV